MTDKRKRYEELIRDVRDFYQSRSNPERDIYLRWCDDCRKHINLWSYWQGSLDARIMVVGQDWGCPEESAVLNNIKAINEGTDSEYHVDQDSITDRNLCTLLDSIGSPAETYNPDLFFTNLALGYRNKGLTGGFRQSWLRECEPFFRRLVDIVDPEVIICLGRNVFVSVTRAMGKKVRVSKYNDFRNTQEHRGRFCVCVGTSVCLPGAETACHRSTRMRKIDFLASRPDKMTKLSDPEYCHFVRATRQFFVFPGSQIPSLRPQTGKKS